MAHPVYHSVCGKIGFDIRRFLSTSHFLGTHPRRKAKTHCTYFGDPLLGPAASGLHAPHTYSIVITDILSLVFLLEKFSLTMPQKRRQSNIYWENTRKSSRADERERKRVAPDSDSGGPSYEGTSSEVERSRVRRTNETDFEHGQRLAQMSERTHVRRGNETDERSERRVGDAA